MKKAIFILLFLKSLLTIDLYAQNKQDSIENENQFDKFYYDVFVHVNKNIGSVDFYSLSTEYLWTGTSGPEKYKEKSLKRLVSNIGKKYAFKVDSANFRIDKEEEMRNYIYQQYLHNRIFSVKFDGKKHKIVAYDVK